MREIKIGKTYRHFKGNVYKVLYIGYDANTNDTENEHQSNHDAKIWVRDYDNFASKVDTKKYPNATQEYRFEEVD